MEGRDEDSIHIHADSFAAWQSGRGEAELLELRVELGGEREWILFPCPSYST